MAITKAFTDAVNTQDVRGIRIMMKDSLLVDLTFRDFEEMSRLAAAIPNLYDVHDGRAFIEDVSSWNDAYMNKLMVQVVGNFSHERLEHLKKVVQHLRPVSEQVQIEKKNYSKSDSDSFHTKNQSYNDYKKQKMEDIHNGRFIKIACGSVTGGVIGGIGAVGIGASTEVAFACTMTGAVVGGAIAYAITRGV